MTDDERFVNENNAALLDRARTCVTTRDEPGASTLPPEAWALLLAVDFEAVYKLGTLKAELREPQKLKLSGVIKPLQVTLTIEQAKALVRWAMEGEKSNGCSGYGATFDGAMSVAHEVREALGFPSAPPAQAP